MDNKTFSVKRDGKPDLHFTAFPADGNGRAFISLKVGESFGGEFQMIFYMADACALAIALENAINHAEPRAVEAADLGLMDEAA
jgi:hypothetical protein